MFSPEEIALLESFKVPCESHPGHVTDFIGVKTSVQFLAGIRDWSGKMIPEIPVPTDGFHAEAVEYLALFNAVMNFGRDEFVCVELGAGWGPWLAAAGVVARRLGFRRVKLVGVEASKQRFDFMREHMMNNGLQQDDAVADAKGSRIQTVLLEAAAWEKDGVVFFPEQDVAHDYGPAASETGSGADYRGHHGGQKGVRAVSLETIFGESPVVHFLHIDIQGGESALCHSGIGTLNERVAHLFIGTHSRKIEGDLFELLFRNGWQLVREQPCAFSPAWRNSTLEALTISDGGQFWINPRLVPSHNGRNPAETSEAAGSTGVASEPKPAEAAALQKELGALKKRLESQARKLTESARREAVLKDILRYHSANPMRALQLWRKRHQLDK